MPGGTDRIRVAVVGGGCAAMAAALELTRPEHAGRYEVTVHQQGWRLGGKGASGRGPYGRIEEHGLHVWMGWYENAFRALRECYDELGLDWREAFQPAPLVAVTDRLADGAWEPWTRVFPPTEGLPGDPLPTPMRWSVAHYMQRATTLLRALVETIGREMGAPPAIPGDAGGDAGDPLGRFVRAGQIATLTGLAQAASLLEQAFGTTRDEPPSLLVQVVDTIGASARRMLDARLAEDSELRRIWEVMDLTIATIRGNLRCGLMTDPRGFDAIDEYDCREWLALNGASPRALDSAYLRSLYDLGFAYEHGDPARPRVAAGQALRGFLRAFFTYRGAFFWKMNAGMGDVVFAPMYEVLRRRGVRFEFFHRLRDVGIAGPDARGADAHVDRLAFDVQARVSGGAAYAPLVDVGGMPCWPAEPHWAQLEDGERLRREGRRFECHWDERREGARTLRVGEDFDLVVLGVGLGAIPYVCRSLVARDPRWREMVEHVGTVATQAFQLWLHADTPALGWSGPPITLSGFVEPFDTWADMGHLLARERWPERPGSLAYFCSVLRDPLDVAVASPAYPGRQREAVRRNAVRFLEDDVRHLWPRAVDASGGFRWDLLVAPDGAHLVGAERFRSQYWIANVSPTERYTLSLPGSGRYRISPLDPTYDNLTVCGDWTDCGFNAGCVEAAVMSGRLAAHALTGRPALDDIPGYDHP
ncbi:MAG: NAD(P)-binding protein [Deltaproteobacteria bacterium]|nr:NAD(P)-binding protein [Deltaproteobacteria bacterium]